MLFCAGQIIKIGRQGPIRVHKAEHVRMLGVRSVADAGGYGEVMEVLVLPSRTLVLKSGCSKQLCGYLNCFGYVDGGLTSFDLSDLVCNLTSKPLIPFVAQANRFAKFARLFRLLG
jgi:hypothetical protein